MLIRHGRPEVVRSSRGEADPGLTEDGQRQARLLAAFLHRAEDLSPDVIVSSPMRRADQTARAVAEPADITVQFDQRLAEFDQGATQYIPPELNSQDKAEQWRALESGVWGSHRFDPDAFEARVLNAIDDIVAANAGRKVAVVCHSGVINVFLSHLLGRKRSMFVRLDYTAFSRILASGAGERQLHSINETPHLLPATDLGLQVRPA